MLAGAEPTKATLTDMGTWHLEEEEQSKGQPSTIPDKKLKTMLNTSHLLVSVAGTPPEFLESVNNFLTSTTNPTSINKERDCQHRLEFHQKQVKECTQHHLEQQHHHAQMFKIFSEEDKWIQSLQAINARSEATEARIRTALELIVGEAMGPADDGKDSSRS
jgi:t-SNARE complex subunit (syntaxin)